jgi:hypothetical protein
MFCTTPWYVLVVMGPIGGRIPKNPAKPASSGLTWYFSASSQNRLCSSLTFSGWVADRSVAWEKSSAS